MSISESFFNPSYDDAPWLADQLLLPNLARGHSIHLLSAFAPSYLFRLVGDLADTEEAEPGFLNIVFFVPGDLSVRSQSIARFKKYLLKYSTDWELYNFVNKALYLIKEGRENGFGGLQISVQHTNQKKPLTKSLAGVIVDQEKPQEYVSFVDAKGGDFNSPVQISKSWDIDQHHIAQEVLGLVASAINNQNPRASLVSSVEVEEWLIYLANYYEENPPQNPELENDENSSDSVDDSDESVDDSDDEFTDEADEFLEHLQNLEDFENEEQYGWFGSDEDDFDLGPVTLEVSRSSAIYGHIPPLERLASMFVGELEVSRCICGKKFIRAYGCDEIIWDRWTLEHREEQED